MAARRFVHSYSPPFHDPRHKRTDKWTVIERRGCTARFHRFHREEQAHAFLSEHAVGVPVTNRPAEMPA